MTEAMNSLILNLRTQRSGYTKSSVPLRVRQRERSARALVGAERTRQPFAGIDARPLSSASYGIAPYSSGTGLNGGRTLVRSRHT